MRVTFQPRTNPGLTPDQNPGLANGRNPGPPNPGQGVRGVRSGLRTGDRVRRSDRREKKGPGPAFASPGFRRAA